MKYDEFRKSLYDDAAPAGSSPYLIAMWHDARDEWDDAHNIVQYFENDTAAWIHAYLHRKEGDIVNADYWYRRAGKKRPGLSLEEEWEEIVKALLRSE